MRTKVVIILLAIVAVMFVATAATAEEVTLSGKVVCAKCTLKKADAKECQDVLVVTGDDKTTKEYYLAKNDVLAKFGHTCKGEKAAVVTGQVSEKDGKTWLMATKIEEKR